MRFLDLNPLKLGEINGTQQPGLSSFTKGKWLHGHDAFSVCRQDPQSTQFTVWENLAVTGPSLPGGMRHKADVGLAQLKAIVGNLAEGEWIVLTPSHWQKEQLQVFLGIAAECKMDVRALLPRSLAVNHFLGSTLEKWTAFEWHWHRLNRICMQRETQGWKIERCETVPEGAVLDFFRRESRAVSKIALESQRVDPLYSGETEQILFDGWWKWHQQQEKWTYQAGGVDLDFSNESANVTQVHQSWLERNSIVKEDTQQSLPDGLSHCLGLTSGMAEVNDLRLIESRLGDLSTPGARWKELLPLGTGGSQKEPSVTHWVVNGIAEKAIPSKSVKPGEQITLADGRDALAIHLPETT